VATFDSTPPASCSLSASSSLVIFEVSTGSPLILIAGLALSLA
jgi:hypothetical protein